MIKPEFVDCQLDFILLAGWKDWKKTWASDLFATHRTFHSILKSQNINGRDVDLLTSSVQISVLTKWVNNNNIQFGKVEDWSLWYNASESTCICNTENNSYIQDLRFPNLPPPPSPFTLSTNSLLIWSPATQANLYMAARSSFLCGENYDKPIYLKAD